jgi:hypothetical protein
MSRLALNTIMRDIAFAAAQFNLALYDASRTRIPLYH